MRIIYLQHVPYEGPGTIAAWAADNGFEFAGRHLYRGDAAPAPGDADALVIMGGPMSVHDEREHPWLQAEKQRIGEWIDADKPVLGICLGGQLIANVMGAPVTRNPEREIGWFPIRLREAAQSMPPASLLPAEMNVFHWHGETFGIPIDATPLASSAACGNQGFVYRDRVLGLQFHLEMDRPTAKALIEHSRHAASDEAYVQSADEMLARPERFDSMLRPMYDLLNWWAGQAPSD